MELGIKVMAVFRPFQKELQSITIKYISNLLYSHFFTVCLNCCLTIRAKPYKLYVKYKIKCSVVYYLVIVIVVVCL